MRQKSTAYRAGAVVWDYQERSERSEGMVATPPLLPLRILRLCLPLCWTQTFGLTIIILVHLPYCS